MVQLMKSSKVTPESQLQQRGKMVPVKREVDDSFDHRHALINKRSKQNELEIGGFPVPPAEFNPLDEPSPLGLRLKKSPSLLDLIQMRLSKGNSSNTGTQARKDNKGATTSLASDKLKASNFHATLLKIGTWEYKSRHEGDLVAKCYFAKHKLVWEVLDGGLKNKIEIQWSDIMALKANYPDDGPGTLDIVLTRQPLFFRETNPQPRKHTLWQATSDFTGGQASLHRRHYLQCAQGMLGKHFEKLIQCDPHLSFLSQQEVIVLESPCFEPRVSVFDDPSESNEYSINTDGGAAFDLRGAASPSGAQSSSSRSELHDPVARPTDFHQGTPSPSSVMDTAVIEEIRNGGVDELRSHSRWDQIKVPGLHPSMSMSDLVNHIENRISEHRTSSNFTLSTEERESLEILEEISQCLLTDSQFAGPTTDEKSLMSRVNSLCCLLQKDPVTVQDLPGKVDNHVTDVVDDKRVNASHCLSASVSGAKVEDSYIAKSEDGECMIKKATGMSREDSVGELLMNLPRIASLPQFFFNM